MSGLLKLSHGGGCGCKLDPLQLADVLGGLPDDDGFGVIRGLGARDDAAVAAWQGGALVMTCDFFTPVVDDARTWGRIAAANALSDVYAMGGTPRFALNILAWPREGVPGQAAHDVLAGGRDTLIEAGAVLVGGHSVDDAEPKYGMAIVGSVDPRRMLTIDRAARGDRLVLTKPLGVGIVITAAKHGRATSDTIAAATATMLALNDTASAAAMAAGVRAATDVSGFGLVGHAHELAEASGVAVELTAAQVPVVPGARDLLAGGLAPSGIARNEAASRGYTDWGTSARALLCDPQSSGGLLLAVPPGVTLDYPTVGRVVDGPPGHVRVLQ
jgi:selenide,water dikinase